MHRYTFSILLCAYVLVALAYSIIIPLGEAPDEVSHWAYVHYLVQHQRLPTPEGAVSGESHQPPLYYTLGALATFWIPDQQFEVIANPDWELGNPQSINLLLHTRQEEFPYRGGALAWHLIRTLSVIMGAVTVGVTWQLAREVFPETPWLALAATAFVAFLPEFVVISAAVNNDNLVIMLASLSLLPICRMIQQRKRPHDAILLGLVLGLAALTKLSGLVVWLFALTILAWRAFATREWKNTALDLLTSMGIATTILTPWMLYNLQQYGDPFGWTYLLSVTPVRTTPMSVGDWFGIFQGLYTSFWGRFGGALHLHLADVVYAALGIPTLIALAGWIGYAHDALKRKLSANARAVFLAFAIFWSLMLAAHARWTLTVLGTDQARQLFPGLPLLAIFLAAGLVRLCTPHEQVALKMWSGGFFALSLAVLWHLNLIYAAPLENPAQLPRLGGTNAPADFGKAIRVLDYRIESPRVAPGDSIAVQVYWQTLDEVQENCWLLLQLADANSVVANKEGVPAAGRITTDRWQKGQTFSSRHTLAIPKDTAAGMYTLRLGLHPFGKWEWLPVRGQDMLPLGNIVVENLR